MTANTELNSNNPKVLIISKNKKNIINISHILQQSMLLDLDIVTHSEYKPNVLPEDSPNLIIYFTHLNKNAQKDIEVIRANNSTKDVPVILVTEYSKTVISNNLDLNKFYPIDIVFTPINTTILTTKINIFLKLYFSEKKLNFIDTELKHIKKELKDQNKQLNYLALHDSLTSTPNRYFFEKSTIQVIKLSKRYQHHFAALLLDIDNFKWINDKFGHNIGDEVLKTVAKKLKSAIRESDLICRFGGDEFGIILSEIKNDINASLVAQKIIEAFHLPLRIKNKSIRISLSVGLTLFHPSSDKNYETIMEEADIAMYKAKQNGKNRFEYFTDSFKDRYNYQHTLNYELQNALGKNELFLKYQPIVNIVNNKIIGVEALLRWHNPKLGNIPPLDFISVAEETGIIYDIGLWIIESACQQIAVWKSLGLLNTYIAINISPMQLKNIRLGEDLTNIAAKYNVKPTDLELEITESAFLSNSGNSLKKHISFLKDFQSRLSLDDFGAEYSSLSRLGKIPLKTLKIDGAFLREMGKYPKNKTILIHLFKLAEQLSMRVIAECVETKKHVEFLKKYGCYFAQGYYYYKPMKAEDITKLLLNN